MTTTESYNVVADEFTFFAGFKDFQEALDVAEGLANDNPEAWVKVRTTGIVITETYRICPTLGVALTTQATTN